MRGERNTLISRFQEPNKLRSKRTRAGQIARANETRLCSDSPNQCESCESCKGIYEVGYLPDRLALRRVDKWHSPFSRRANARFRHRELACNLIYCCTYVRSIASWIT